MSAKKLQRIIFGIGSNLGKREFYIESALTELIDRLNLTNSKKSNFFENPAMLLPNSPSEWNRDFLNIAFSADIEINNFSAEKILKIVKEIEKKIGRKERAKWAPREIDIDILAIGNLQINIEGLLKIPHPGLFKRDFFFKTTKEIEPHLLNNLKNLLS